MVRPISQLPTKSALHLSGGTGGSVGGNTIIVSSTKQAKKIKISEVLENVLPSDRLKVLKSALENSIPLAKEIPDILEELLPTDRLSGLKLIAKKTEIESQFGEISDCLLPSQTAEAARLLYEKCEPQEAEEQNETVSQERVQEILNYLQPEDREVLVAWRGKFPVIVSDQESIKTILGKLFLAIAKFFG